MQTIIWILPVVSILCLGVPAVISAREGKWSKAALWIGVAFALNAWPLYVNITH